MNLLLFFLKIKSELLKLSPPDLIGTMCIFPSLSPFSQVSVEADTDCVLDVLTFSELSQLFLDNKTLASTFYKYIVFQLANKIKTEQGMLLPLKVEEKNDNKDNRTANESREDLRKVSKVQFGTDPLQISPSILFGLDEPLEMNFSPVAMQRRIKIIGQLFLFSQVSKIFCQKNS